MNDTAANSNASSWMRGFPPPHDRTIRFEDLPGLAWPAHRWVYCHWRELVPTARVWRGRRPPRPLPAATQPLKSFAFVHADGERWTLEQALERTDTDGLLVLHDGRVLFETYRGELRPHLAHRCFSVTKSFVGLLSAVLAHEGVLDPAALVVSVLPELNGSGWGEATFRQVMDMTLNLEFDEDYEKPDGDVVRAAIAKGTLPCPPGYAGPRTQYAFLPTVRAGGEHDRVFRYATPNTEVLAWALQRLTGHSLAALLSERIWQRIGADEDAEMSIDTVGAANAGGGLCVTLRDLARFGEAIRNRGRVDGEAVIPDAAIGDIARGGDREKFARAGWDMFDGWSYRNQWWIAHDEFEGMRALGIHGQQLYIAPRAGLVIARFGSQKVAVDEPVERLMISTYRALARALTS